MLGAMKKNDSDLILTLNLLFKVSVALTLC